MEKREWIRGRWVEKAGQRRRRYYNITPKGRDVADAQVESWLEFVRAIGQVAGLSHA
jgi:PadR family transcriptional regulator PadR